MKHDYSNSNVIYILLGRWRYLVWRPWAIISPVFFFFNSTLRTATAFPARKTLASISISSYIGNNICKYINGLYIISRKDTGKNPKSETLPFIDSILSCKREANKKNREKKEGNTKFLTWWSEVVAFFIAYVITWEKTVINLYIIYLHCLKNTKQKGYLLEIS